MDSVMPRLATRQGAQVLAVPTNDAWFRQTGTPMNHFEMAIMRAVENRRPVVQCGNTGISGFIDPWGRVLAETRLDERTVLVHEVSPVAVTSVYTRIGDVLAYLCVLAWALTLGRWRMRPARGVRQESGGKSS
ncbi:MAG TPA: nitrilase-related carbon-nitrogen hydrolase, partial [Candidatus Nitrosotenuis sp.]|nr:nitrilase-related carbon-nitrogen hydrolase [Candidatus Nitrosotenuis sp.]